MEQFFEGLADDLTVYVRQFAWLTVERDRPKDDTSAKDKSVPSYMLPSRLEQMRIDKKDSSYQPLMPPVEAGKHIVDFLFEFGPLVRSGDGSGPMTHTEIRNFQENTGVEFDSWGARLLFKLSREYYSESNRAKSVDCPEPWDQEKLLVGGVKKPVMTSLQRHMRMLAQK